MLFRSTESSGSVGIPRQILDHSSHHPRAWSFPGVDPSENSNEITLEILSVDSPCTQYNANLPLDLLQAVRGGDGQQVDIVTGQGPAQHLLGTKLGPVWVALDV